ncbi:MAG: OmpH family outer membrane protein [Litorimonas sp.]
MTFLKFSRLAVIGAAISLLASVQAFAQSTILVVDTQRVIRESDVGKHIARQLETISKSMDAEFKATATPYQTKAKSLQAQLQGQTAQSLRTDTALQAQIRDLKADEVKVQEDLYYKQNELKLTEAKAIEKVNVRLREVLKAIVAERNADVVLERSLVIYGDPADVTSTVITRLNAQVKTVPVTRERLPRKAK